MYLASHFSPVYVPRFFDTWCYRHPLSTMPPVFSLFISSILWQQPHHFPPSLSQRGIRTWLPPPHVWLSLFDVKKREISFTLSGRLSGNPALSRRAFSFTHSPKTSHMCTWIMCMRVGLCVSTCLICVRLWNHTMCMIVLHTHTQESADIPFTHTQVLVNPCLQVYETKIFTAVSSLQKDTS